MSALLLALAIVAPGHTYTDPRYCRMSEVTITLPINYDAPTWDDSIGAQAGIWWTLDAGIVGYSYQEDGIVYRTLSAADRCSVYPS